jgi:2-amino-4-hydroxy-6-hydroxymethyldihydropteridine diphosphokinase
MTGEDVKHEVYLGLGSNLGDRETIITHAIELIGEKVGLVIRQSSLIETEPWGFESENKFLNGVILVETTLTPRQLLKVIQKIERELGKRRKHATRRSQLSTLNSQLSTFNDRPIDIDILLYDDLTVDEPDLKIPHPLMYERDFVMIPLKQIKPR